VYIHINVTAEAAEKGVGNLGSDGLESGREEKAKEKETY